MRMEKDSFGAPPLTAPAFLESRLWIPALLVYVLFAVLWFRPILADLRGTLPLGIDASEPAWRFWWTRKALLDLGQLPYWCEYLLYPQGLSLFCYDLFPLYGILALPWTWSAPSPGAFIEASNFLSILTFPVAGLLACALCYRVSKSPLGAIAGGLAFGFAPMRVAELDSINILSGYWIPALFLLAGLRESPRSWTRALLVGACLLGTFFTSYTVFLLAALSVPFIALPRIAGASSKMRALRREILFWLCASIPLVLFLSVTEAATPGRLFSCSYYTESPLTQVESFSATPSNMFTSRQRLWSNKARGLVSAMNDRKYLGFMLPVLALIGLCSGAGRRLRALAMLGALSLVLALGMHVSILGAKIPLPFRLLQSLGPPFSFFRAPYRFLFLASLVLSVFLAVGVAECVRFARSRRNPRRAWLLGATAAALLALVVEYWPAHFETADVVIPTALSAARSRGTGPGSVLILPAKTYADRARQRLYQIVLDRPLPIAPIPRVDRLAAEPYRSHALFRMLAEGEEEKGILDHDLSELDEARVSCLIVSRAELESRPRLAAWLERYDSARIVESDTFSIYGISSRAPGSGGSADGDGAGEGGASGFE